MAARNPKARTRDMVISLAVILIPVLLIVAFFSLPADDAPEAVDVAPVLARAQTASPYPLIVAEGLDAGWTPVRAAFAADGDAWIDSRPAVGDSWQVGYLSPEGTYFGVQQRNASETAFIDDITRDGVAMGGQVDAAGRTWERFESRDGRTRTLVSLGDDSTAVVAADTDFLELEAFAALLVQVVPD